MIGVLCWELWALECIGWLAGSVHHDWRPVFSAVSIGVYRLNGLVHHDWRPVLSALSIGVYWLIGSVHHDWRPVLSALSIGVYWLALCLRLATYVCLEWFMCQHVPKAGSEYCLSTYVSHRSLDSSSLAQAFRQINSCCQPLSFLFISWVITLWILLIYLQWMFYNVNVYLINCMVLCDASKRNEAYWSVARSFVLQ